MDVTPRRARPGPGSEASEKNAGEVLQRSRGALKPRPESGEGVPDGKPFRFRTWNRPPTMRPTAGQLCTTGARESAEKEGESRSGRSKEKERGVPEGGGPEAVE